MLHKIPLAFVRVIIKFWSVFTLPAYWLAKRPSRRVPEVTLTHLDSHRLKISVVRRETKVVAFIEKQGSYTKTVIGFMEWAVDTFPERNFMGHREKLETLNPTQDGRLSKVSQSENYDRFTGTQIKERYDNIAKGEIS